MKSKHVGKDKQSGSKFSAMLEQSLQGQASLTPGAPVIATVTSIDDREFVMVRSEHGTGMIERAQLSDSDGKLEIGIGDKVQAFFVGEEHGDLTFTTEPKGGARTAVLEHAEAEGLPLRGRVTKRVKGGFEVELGEVRAFCPASQLEHTGEPLGLHLPFLILERDSRGVVVSHRAFRDQEREIQKGVLQESLAEGDIVTGIVRSLQTFGAFVEFSGIDGLIPISELAFQRVEHPREVLTVGQEVRVKVMRLDWKENRIALSYKALLANPWQGALPFKEGDILEGDVDSVKTFGVFVRLPGQFTGLVPNAESGHVKGTRLETEFQGGQKLRVMVKSIDRQSERISLSVKAVGDADTRAEYEDYMKAQPADGGSISSFGKQLLESLGDENKKK